MTSPARFIVTTGGTGGHIFPALAAAQEFKRRMPDAEILFVGGKYGPEQRFAEAAGLKFAALPARGVLGRGAKALGAMIRQFVSVLKAWNLIRTFKPVAVVGFGGYAGFAPVAAAWLRGTPRAIHEQNALPGLANRVLGRLANRVLLSFPDDNKLFDEDKVVVTGNPVRSEIITLGENFQVPAETIETRRLLVVGGSQGAHALNQAVSKALPGLAAKGFELRHQTGEADLADVQEAYRAQGLDESAASAFIDDMAEAYHWADLVLCRAGASTVAELAVAGKPSLLVPFPHATHQHQLQNARHLETAGAAKILTQNLLEQADLAEVVGELFEAPGRIRNMALAARETAIPDAAARLCAAVEQMAKPK
jgi:UDP-N-acetylglucosamine--N-acetylmuramyl-(pentapeptide) pyrophosphoryl-undecaprenol N-acetylglucosamine transferase